MIRQAEIKDLPELYRMIDLFHEATGPKAIGKMDYDSMEHTFKVLIDENILLTDGKSGMLGILVYKLFYNHSIKVAQEIFWWVDEDKRGKGFGLELLKEAEKKVKEMGAKALFMLKVKGLGDERLDALYKALGYIEQETTYRRDL